MICTISELLLEIEQKGIKQIKKFPMIKHPTMIGDMYEGLTKELLNKAIFKDFDLRVVSGKIVNDLQELSGQIDCMIVIGEGEKLPFSKDYIYKSEQVISVFEVKKNLFSKDLIEAYYNLKTAYNVCEPVQFEISIFRDAYRSIVREELPIKSELENLPFFKQMIYHSLIVEASMPLRIVFGYEGFKNEYNLRKAFMEFIQESTNGDTPVRGLGPNNLPHLIICNNYSLIKTNGMPYCPPLLNDKWLFYASYNRSPLKLLLELLWTKLTYRFGINSDVFGEDLSSELLRPFLLGKCFKRNEIIAWEYYENEIPKNDLENLPVEANWEPVFLEGFQYHVINGLCSLLPANLNDKDFVEFLLANSGFSSIEEFTEDILQTGLVYLDDNSHLKLLTDECAVVILPGGIVVAGENRSGRLSRWVLNYNKSEKNR